MFILNAKFFAAVFVIARPISPTALITKILIHDYPIPSSYFHPIKRHVKSYKS